MGTLRDGSAVDTASRFLHTNIYRITLQSLPRHRCKEPGFPGEEHAAGANGLNSLTGAVVESIPKRFAHVPSRHSLWTSVSDLGSHLTWSVAELHARSHSSPSQIHSLGLISAHRGVKSAQPLMKEVTQQGCQPNNIDTARAQPELFSVG